MFTATCREAITDHYGVLEQNRDLKKHDASTSKCLFNLMLNISELNRVRR